jgi:MobA/MobL family
MAIMFLKVSSVSRGRGGSAVAKAAYIARERVVDARSGLVRDYRHVPGLEHAEILVPSDTPGAGAEWARDRATLWNSAESAERQRNARVAREYTVSLPHELSRDARHALAKEFAQNIADRYGTAVDLAVHGPTPRGDPRNFHAHLLATTRELTPDGLGRKATIELNSARRRELGLQHIGHEFKALRAQWAALANAKLREANIEARLEPRSRATLAREHAAELAVLASPQALQPTHGGHPSMPSAAPDAVSPTPLADPQPRTIEAIQQRAAEQWLAYRAERADDAQPRREHARDLGHDAGLEI